MKFNLHTKQSGRCLFCMMMIFSSPSSSCCWEGISTGQLSSFLRIPSLHSGGSAIFPSSSLDFSKKGFPSFLLGGTVSHLVSLCQKYVGAQPFLFRRAYTEYIMGEPISAAERQRSRAFIGASNRWTLPDSKRSPCQRPFCEKGLWSLQTE